MTPTADILRHLAAARRDYATPWCRDEVRALILHEAAVLDAVADVLAGDRRWDHLIASYAPSWRWHQFGEHSPNHRLRDPAPSPDATRGE